MMMANRILVGSNTISYIIYNFLISANRKMLFDVVNIRVVRWKHQLYTILQLGCKSFPLILHRQSTNECTDLIIIKKNESQKE